MEHGNPMPDPEVSALRGQVQTLAGMVASLQSRLQVVESDNNEQGGDMIDTRWSMAGIPEDLYGGGGDAVQDFDLRIENGSVIRGAGKRCVIDSGWQDVAEATIGSGNGTAWMKYTYTGKLANGTQPSNPGWSEGFGAPPAQNDTCRVFLIGTVTDGDIQYHERGAKVVLDLGNC